MLLARLLLLITIFDLSKADPDYSTYTSCETLPSPITSETIMTYTNAGTIQYATRIYVTTFIDSCITTTTSTISVATHIYD